MLSLRLLFLLNTFKSKTEWRKIALIIVEKSDMFLLLNWEHADKVLNKGYPLGQNLFYILECGKSI
jgi:hypothetical protein